MEKNNIHGQLFMSIQKFQLKNIDTSQAQQ